MQHRLIFDKMTKKQVATALATAHQGSARSAVSNDMMGCAPLPRRSPLSTLLSPFSPLLHFNYIKIDRNYSFFNLLL